MGIPRSAALMTDMVDYLRTGNPKGELIAAYNAEPAGLRLVCISILEWLTSRSRFPTMITMTTSEAGSARDALIALVSRVEPFTSTFQIETDKLRIHSSIKSDDVDQLIKIASEFKPPRFVTKNHAV